MNIENIEMQRMDIFLRHSICVFDEKAIYDPHSNMSYHHAFMYSLSIMHYFRFTASFAPEWNHGSRLSWELWHWKPLWSGWALGNHCIIRYVAGSYFRLISVKLGDNCITITTFIYNGSNVYTQIILRGNINNSILLWCTNICCHVFFNTQILGILYSFVQSHRMLLTKSWCRLQSRSILSNHL